MDKIRNIVIIAHIDHGKSTLSDRMLEKTGTVEKRLMQAQYLDSMDLERERGITIKMAPVRMVYKEHLLNLIDTPGHSDFGYEVSRALQAVEGAILLVDATQGAQAQTLSNFELAKKAGLKIIGVVNKIDMASEEQIEEAILELSEMLEVSTDEIIKASGKTGEGVEEILDKVIKDVPFPKNEYSDDIGRGLIFDSQYDEHKGVVAFIRVFGGEFTINNNYHLLATNTEVKTKDIGYLEPKFKTSRVIKNGEIGYVATGIKDPDKVKIGDTVSTVKADGRNIALPGYKEASPVVFVSFYPENPEDYDDFKKSLAKLRLSDSALIFEPDTSEVLGRGFKGGFLGRLHFEITVERIDREFNISVVTSFPSVAYKVGVDSRVDSELEPAEDGLLWVKNPKEFPVDFSEVHEPITKIDILSPMKYLGAILQLKELFRIRDIETKNLGSKVLITAKLPLADLISDFDDKLKSVSQGFGSLNYKIIGYEKAELDKLEILVAEQAIPGLTRILPKKDMESIGRSTCEKLKKLLPKQQFPQAIQAKYRGRIIARETIPAMSKNVTGHLYGGDLTRKMKLWKKQKKGKKKLKERGTKSGVKISPEVFKELLRK